MNWIKYSVFALFFITLGCSNVVNCLIKIEPNLEEDGFNDGVVSQNYEEYIDVDMLNAGNSNYAINTLEITGDLPIGIEAYYNDMRIYFNGIPTTIGTYNFDVKVIVEYIGDSDNENDDNLCGNTVSGSYTIKIY